MYSDSQWARALFTAKVICLLVWWYRSNAISDALADSATGPTTVLFSFRGGGILPLGYFFKLGHAGPAKQALPPPSAAVISPTCVIIPHRLASGSFCPLPASTVTKALGLWDFSSGFCFCCCLGLPTPPHPHPPGGSGGGEVRACVRKSLHC